MFVFWLTTVVGDIVKSRTNFVFEPIDHLNCQD